MTNLKVDIEHYKDIVREINLDITEMNELEEKILADSFYNCLERRQDLQICRDRLNKMIDCRNHQLDVCEKAIRTDLQGLTDCEQQIITMRVLDGLNWGIIVRRFSRSRNWVRKKYKQALNKGETKKWKR